MYYNNKKHYNRVKVQFELKLQACALNYKERKKKKKACASN